MDSTQHKRNSAGHHVSMPMVSSHPLPHPWSFVDMGWPSWYEENEYSSASQATLVPESEGKESILQPADSSASTLPLHSTRRNTRPGTVYHVPADRRMVASMYDISTSNSQPHAARKRIPQIQSYGELLPTSGTLIRPKSLHKQETARGLHVCSNQHHKVK